MDPGKRRVFKCDQRAQAGKFFVIRPEMRSGNLHKRNLTAETFCTVARQILRAELFGNIAQGTVYTGIQTAFLIRKRQQKADQGRKNKQDCVPERNAEFDGTEQAGIIP